MPRPPRIGTPISNRADAMNRITTKEACIANEGDRRMTRDKPMTSDKCTTRGTRWTYLPCLAIEVFRHRGAIHCACLRIDDRTLNLQPQPFFKLKPEFRVFISSVNCSAKSRSHLDCTQVPQGRTDTALEQRPCTQQRGPRWNSSGRVSGRQVNPQEQCPCHW